MHSAHIVANPSFPINTVTQTLQRSQSQQSINMSAATPTQIIEHLVVFKLKPDVDPSVVPAMINSFNSLASLDGVLHLTTGPLIRCQSSSLTFNHIIHCRFASKADFDKFYVDPAHHVVINETKPLFEDLLAVDWVHSADSITIPPGSTIRATFLKLKENLEEKEKNELLGVVGGPKEKFPSIQVLSFGENNTPARAKGISIISIAVFKGINELEAFHSEWEAQANEHKDLVRDKVDEALVLDFVLP